MNEEAEIKYLDGEFAVIKNGAFVMCAVSGKKIPLHQLRYWSVERQEAYADAACALQRALELKNEEKK